MTSGDEEWKELRIRIEASYHKKLVALKVLRHKTMSEAIHEALDHYFSDVLPDAPRIAPPSAAAGSPARPTDSPHGSAHPDLGPRHREE